MKSSKKRRLEHEVANQEAPEQKVPSIINNDIDNNTNTYDVNNEMFNFIKTKDKVVNFIRKKETFCKGTKEYIHDNNLPENVIKTEDSEESYTLDFQNALDDLVQADNASQCKGNLNSAETNVINNEVNHNVTNLNDNQGDTQNTNNSDEFDIPTIEVNTIVPIQTLKDGIRDNISTIKMNYAQVSNDAGESSNKQNSNHVSNTTECYDELKFLESVKVDEDINNLHCKPGDNNASIKNAVKTEDFEETPNVPEAKSEESDDVERKLLELEKQVLDRFKGSLLDKML